MKGIPSDQELLQGLRSGRQEAFKCLYQQHYPMVRYLVVQNSGSTEEADDVFQDGLLVLIHKLRGGDFQLTASLKTYLYAVCRNLWLKRLKDKGRTKLIDFENPVDVADEAPEESNEPVLKSLRECLEAIGDSCRKILERYYYLKMSMEEIAADLGYTNADNVKNQKYKCILRLRKLMDEKKGRA
ncbi:MAG TPA: sigma-70 family RNA polymerase sigma factor [Bacteroidia bacterium]|jgi:RNA polymerase sigma factor (sigma-70 family)|nr:sigma-70 family RNA polymerase sigma factor [Bacteroidia bacterium]